MNRVLSALVWVVLALVVVVSIVAAAMSPLLAWRDPIYIAAGFAGILAVILLLFQPLLAAAYLPGFSVRSGRQVHRWVGIALVLTVVAHVVGLWITSPPDVIDALLFASPTQFSVWGVIAMWAVFATATLAGVRRTLKLRATTWSLAHKSLAIIIVVGSVVHALLIEGTMEVMSKAILCTLLLAVTVVALFRSS